MSSHVSSVSFFLGVIRRELQYVSGELVCYVFSAKCTTIMTSHANTPDECAILSWISILQNVN